MPLAAGTRFGPYEIAEPIGAGGMGEVYRARDTTLERDVAIKVLPESFAADAGRVARFEHEAKTLAALNHPNVAQVYGLEKAGGVHALVMELVAGPTLAERIESGPLPVDEALNVAMQIADALEAAHAVQIVHRDLKPANVKLRDDHTVKVLDFGIAKALGTQASASGTPAPMLTTPAMTMAGVILGTAAYMAPEQARGKAIDQRTDIWAFGCVLYEMLTGQPAFGGEDVTITLARVTIDKTDLDSLPRNVPAAVRHTIALCLEKDPRKRIADIRDVKLALEGRFEAAGPAPAEAARARVPFWLRPLPVAAASLAVGAGLAGLVLTGLEPDPVPKPLSRFSHVLPDRLTTRRQGENVVAVAPDGRHFVVNTTAGLYLRPLASLEGRLIPGTEEDIAAPFFSPDGQSIGYWAATGEIKRVGVGGGAPVVVASVDTLSGGIGLAGAPRGASWAADGTILTSQDAGVVRVPANGGQPELLIPAEGAERFNGPTLLPDSDTVIFGVAEGPQWDRGLIVAQSISSGERTVLIEGGSSARYVDSGHLVYALGDGLFAKAFDAETLTVSGGVVPVVAGVQRALTAISGLANYGITDDGTLIYLAGGATEENFALESAWIGRDGREQAVGVEPCPCMNPAVSPDGTRIALMQFDTASGETDLWIWTIAQRTLTRLTFETGQDTSPVWSPDSERIAYNRDDGIYVRRADGTGAVERVLEGAAVPYSWSGDGEILYSATGGGAQRAAIGVLSADGDPMPRILIDTPYDDVRPALSPDGRWLAYESDDSGRSEVFVRPYPDVDAGRWQVSTRGGRTPQWSADSGALFFVGPEAVMRAGVGAGATFRFDTPAPMLDHAGYMLVPMVTRDYTVSSDGERVLLFRNVGTSRFGGSDTLVIVENWVEELKRLVPVD